MFGVSSVTFSVAGPSFTSSGLSTAVRVPFVVNKFLMNGIQSTVYNRLMGCQLDLALNYKYIGLLSVMHDRDMTKFGLDWPE